jgi:hypothetical protein
MTQEISGKRVKVLPIMLEPCELPGFLLGKFYADFTDEQTYDYAFEKLITSIGCVFNRNALRTDCLANNLMNATDKAFRVGLPLLSHPFHRPFQYIGLTLADAAEAVKQSPNEAGNIIVDSEDCHMLLEAEGNFVSYVDAELKITAPHYQNQEFDSEPILGAFSINPAELELVRKITHSHVYYDHRKRLKISIMCAYDEAPLSIGFSSKYYGM